MALMAFQFEIAEAIGIESGSNVTLANIASRGSGADPASCTVQAGRRRQ
jgi:hypothetical protein